MFYYKTGIQDFRIKIATREDVPVILKFIRELAEYEHMLSYVVATEELLTEWIFVKEKAEVYIAVYKNNFVGFALFFTNFSTFLGRGGMFLEDLYIQSDFRKKGFGKEILKRLARTALDRGCGRLEWNCLNWNTPSVNFYLSLGAKPLSDWTTYRLTGETLEGMAEN